MWTFCCVAGNQHSVSGIGFDLCGNHEQKKHCGIVRMFCAGTVSGRFFHGHSSFLFQVRCAMCVCVCVCFWSR